jgi:quercetin dioxygenase-like cupin family protein
MSLETNPTTGLVIELFGPTVEFLTSPEDEGNDFCVLKGTIPPGISVPLHSHPDTEDFFVISGSVESLRHGTEGYQWIAAKAGDFIHIPGGTQHAWRNVSGEPVVNLIITTKRLGRFFQEVGKTGRARSPTHNARGSRPFRSYQCQIRLLERHSRRKRGGRDYFEFFTPRRHMSKSRNRAMQLSAYAPHAMCSSS